MSISWLVNSHDPCASLRWTKVYVIFHRLTLSLFHSVFLTSFATFSWFQNCVENCLSCPSHQLMWHFEEECINTSFWIKEVRMQMKYLQTTGQFYIVALVLFHLTKNIYEKFKDNRDVLKHDFFHMLFFHIFHMSYHKTCFNWFLNVTLHWVRSIRIWFIWCETVQKFGFVEICHCLFATMHG